MRHPFLRPALLAVPCCLLLPALLGISQCGGGGTDVDMDDWTAEQGDCDDTDPSIHPTATEICDGVDQDCDGTADDACVVDPNPETDCDNQDNDLDGVVDDGCAADAPTGTISEWTRVDFAYIDWRVGCHGDRYVRSNSYGYVTGVILCSSTEFKIMLGTSAGGVFYSIGDTCGSGEDHCEFVGAEPGTVYNSTNAADERTAWSRCDSYQQPQFGTLATNNWVAESYSCNISLP